MKIIWFILLAVCGVLESGCAWRPSSAGSLRAQSLRDDPVVLAGEFDHAYFAYDPDAETTFMLSDAPIDSVMNSDVTQGQLLHIELIWLPKPGATPLTSNATNVSIRYVVIADREVGVYGGAGFAMPGESLAHKTVTLTLRDASMQLLQSTPGFVDLLSPAQLTGTFTAVRNDDKARQLNRAASQIVTNALGRTTYVLSHTDRNVVDQALMPVILMRK